MRWEVNETVRVVYEAKRLTTGLADVKCTIWDPTPTKDVDAETMTELGNGIYYYDYVPSAEGNYLYFCDSDSQPRRYTGIFYAGTAIGGAASIADAVWNEAAADHTASGSFGEAANKVKTWVGWLRSLLF
ncbi:MAG: hypothetical protein KAV87_08070 [Desulfobacteraceae bacterium]|nr:hypothetical protein [Desulfobacteraceae bacterium]